MIYTFSVRPYEAEVEKWIVYGRGEMNLKNKLVPDCLELWVGGVRFVIGNGVVLGRQFVTDQFCGSYNLVNSDRLFTGKKTN